MPGAPPRRPKEPKCLYDFDARRSQNLLRKLTFPRTKTPMSSSASQEKCGFFRLPWELRERVYGLVYGECHVDLLLTDYAPPNTGRAQLLSRWLDLESAEKIAVHHPKLPGQWDKRSTRYIFPQSEKRSYYWWQATRSNKNMLGLLLSCRRFYQESVSTLYKTNVFHTVDPNALALFSRSIPDSQLDNVRALRIHYLVKWFQNPAYEDCNKESLKQWTKFWQLLASFKGLEHLFVRLWDHRAVINVGEAEVGEFTSTQLLDPLKAVTSPGDFRFMLALPDRIDADGLKVPGTSCRIVKTKNLSQEDLTYYHAWVLSSEANQAMVSEDEGQTTLDAILGRLHSKSVVFSSSHDCPGGYCDMQGHPGTDVHYISSGKKIPE